MLKHSIQVFCILLTLVGSSCSLQDHTVPEPQNPETPDTGTPVTNEFKVSTTGVTTDGGKLYLQGKIDQVDPTYKKRGVIGILVSSRVTDNGQINTNPILSNDPLVRLYLIKQFGTDPDDNSFTPLQTGLVSAPEPFAFTEQYFRTVLILEDEKIIYGNVFHQSGLSLPANPKSWELITKEIDFDGLKLSISERGQIPAIEVGFAVSYKEKDSDKINNIPTISDKKVIAEWKFDVSDYLGNEEQIGPNTSLFQKINFNYKEIYYRAYLILQDGSIVYGNVMHEKK